MLCDKNVCCNSFTSFVSKVSFHKFPWYTKGSKALYEVTLLNIYKFDQSWKAGAQCTPHMQGKSISSFLQHTRRAKLPHVQTNVVIQGNGHPWKHRRNYKATHPLTQLKNLKLTTMKSGLQSMKVRRDPVIIM